MKMWLLGLLSLVFISHGAEVESLAKGTQAWTGAPLGEYYLKNPEVSIKKITIAPGEKLPWHTHPYINAGVLLSGELHVFTQDKSLIMKAGDSLIEVINTPHYGINPGKEAAVIVVFYLAEKGEAVTIIDNHEGHHSKTKF